MYVSIPLGSPRPHTPSHSTYNYAFASAYTGAQRRRDLRHPFHGDALLCLPRVRRGWCGIACCWSVCWDYIYSNVYCLCNYACMCDLSQVFMCMYAYGEWMCSLAKQSIWNDFMCVHEHECVYVCSLAGMFVHMCVWLQVCTTCIYMYDLFVCIHIYV